MMASQVVAWQAGQHRARFGQAGLGAARCGWAGGASQGKERSGLVGRVMVR